MVVRPIRWRPPPAHGRQRGQAMVEFAIIVLVLILLIAGGIELALAAFSGQRSSDAARAAVADWVYATGNAGVYMSSATPLECSEDPVYGIYGENCVDWQISNSPHVEPPLPEPQVGLGDHAQSFDRPACDPNDAAVYDDGLPDDSVTNPDDPGTAVYLFNPRPIDLTDCIGQDGDDASRTRRAVLIEKLPALNRALYSSYQKHCGDADGNEVICGDPAVVSTYLRLPGRLDPVTDTVGIGVLDNDPDSPGFQFPLDAAPRPAFEIECAPGGTTDYGACDTMDSDAGRDEPVCWREQDSMEPVPLACEVRVRVRYRYVFNAFLQFPFMYWQDPLPPEALEQLDRGPGGAGTVGSEVARGNVRRLQRTFLGCWETVTIGPTAGMQGSRNLRACN